MAGATGLEPEIGDKLELLKKGQEYSFTGQSESQLAINEHHPQIITPELQTEPGHSKSSLGQSQNIVGTQQEHNSNTADELEKLVAVWPLLPSIVKHGIIAMIDATCEIRLKGKPLPSLTAFCDNFA